MCSWPAAAAHLSRHRVLHLLLVVCQAGQAPAKAKADTDWPLEPVGGPLQGLGVACSTNAACSQSRSRSRFRPDAQATRVKYQQQVQSAFAVLPTSSLPRCRCFDSCPVKNCAACCHELAPARLLPAAPPAVCVTLKSALTVSTPELVQSSTLLMATLPSNTLELNTPGMVGLHCKHTQHSTYCHHSHVFCLCFSSHAVLRPSG